MRIVFDHDVSENWVAGNVASALALLGVAYADVTGRPLTYDAIAEFAAKTALPDGVRVEIIVFDDGSVRITTLASPAAAADAVAMIADMAPMFTTFIPMIAAAVRAR